MPKPQVELEKLASRARSERCLYSRFGQSFSTQCFAAFYLSEEYMTRFSIQAPFSNAPALYIADVLRMCVLGPFYQKKPHQKLQVSYLSPCDHPIPCYTAQKCLPLPD